MKDTKSDGDFSLWFLGRIRWGSFIRRQVCFMVMWSWRIHASRCQQRVICSTKTITMQSIACEGVRHCIFSCSFLLFLNNEPNSFFRTETKAIWKTPGSPKTIQAHILFQRLFCSIENLYHRKLGAIIWIVNLISRKKNKNPKPDLFFVLRNLRHCHSQCKEGVTTGQTVSRPNWQHHLIFCPRKIGLVNDDVVYPDL